MTIRVLVDACLLVKGNVSNVLFDLANVGLISLHWTPEIAQQFVKNWASTRVEREESELKQKGSAPYSAQEMSAALTAATRRAQDRLSKFRLMQRERAIPGWDVVAAAIAHPPNTLSVGKPGGVHHGDYEIALAAIKLKEIFLTDNIWLATENISHLPPKILASFEVWSLPQGLLLEELDSKFPAEVLMAIEKTMSDSKHPPLTRPNMLNILGNPQEFASGKVQAKLQTLWGLEPTPLKQVRKVQRVDEALTQ